MNDVAWRTGKGWTSVWHLESEPNQTLCGRTVPTDTDVSRERRGNAPTCLGCETVLHWREQRPRLVPDDAA